MQFDGMVRRHEKDLALLLPEFERGSVSGNVASPRGAGRWEVLGVGVLLGAMDKEDLEVLRRLSKHLPDFSERAAEVIGRYVGRDAETPDVHYLINGAEGEIVLTSSGRGGTLVDLADRRRLVDYSFREHKPFLN